MTGKRNNVQVNLIRGNSRISNSPQADIKSFKELVEKGSKKEKIVDPVQLISRIDYPEYVEYDGGTIRVSPRSKLKIADAKKLGELPKGIFKKKLSGTPKVDKTSQEEKTTKEKSKK